MSGVEFNAGSWLTHRHVQEGRGEQVLAAFKRPRHIVFVDALPKTATGKIQRFNVRQFLTDVEAPAADQTAETVTTSQGVHQ